MHAEGLFIDYVSVWRRSHLARWLPAFLAQLRDRRRKAPEGEPRGRVIAEDGMVLRSPALEGEGSALLPRWRCADELRPGTLVDVFPTHDVTATAFDASVWRSTAHVATCLSRAARSSPSSASCFAVVRRGRRRLSARRTFERGLYWAFAPSHWG